MTVQAPTTIWETAAGVRPVCRNVAIPIENAFIPLCISFVKRLEKSVKACGKGVSWRTRRLIESLLRSVCLGLGGQGERAAWRVEAGSGSKSRLIDLHA